MHLGRQHKIYAAIRTIIVFTILVLLLLWIHFRTPIPPYPEGGGGPGMGLEVNLGSSDQGMGDNQQSEPVNMPNFTPPPPADQESEKLLTQDNDENESIDASIKKEEVKKEPKKIHHKKTEEPKKIKPDKAKETAETPVLNQKALFKAQKSSNEGTTGQTGDQGNPNGIPGSPLYKGGGNGAGGGTGGGSGTGTGTGAGPGISSNLEARVVFLQNPDYNSQTEGKVVVEITVDKDGRVTNAVPGVKGSTTLDDYLLQVAKTAAQQSKFSRKPDATVQKGTITYRFLLQ